MVPQSVFIKREILVGAITGCVGGALFFLAFSALVALVDAINPDFFRLMGAVVEDEYKASDRTDQWLIWSYVAGPQLWMVGVPLLLCIMFWVAWMTRRRVARAPTRVLPQEPALRKSLVLIMGFLLVVTMPAIRGLVQQIMIAAGWRVPDTVLTAATAVLCLASFGAVTGWLESIYRGRHGGGEPDQVSRAPSPSVGNRGGAEPGAAADRPRE